MACFSHRVIRKYFAGFEGKDGSLYDEFGCSERRICYLLSDEILE